jgi:predicted anti-sigma-YlaC factor YlaD
VTRRSGTNDRTAACERTRRAISLRLDGELSAVGEQRLLRHLGGCEDCARFAISVAIVTLALRSGAGER